MSQRLAEIDISLAQQVAELVGGTKPEKQTRPNHGKTAKNLSQFEFPSAKPTIASRRVAIIIADGFDDTAFNAVKTALKTSSALPFIIAPRRSEVFPAGVDKIPGNGIKPDHHLEGMRSTMFDAVFVPGGAESVNTLSKSGRALHWVREAFGHLKPISGTGEAIELFKIAFALPAVEMSRDNTAIESYGVVTLGKVAPDSLSETINIAKEGAGFLEKFWYQIAQHRNFQRELDGLNAQVAY